MPEAALSARTLESLLTEQPHFPLGSVMAFSYSTSALKDFPEDPESREQNPPPQGTDSRCHMEAREGTLWEMRPDLTYKGPVCKEMSLLLRKSVVLSAPCNGKWIKMPLTQQIKLTVK